MIMGNPLAAPAPGVKAAAKALKIGYSIAVQRLAAKAVGTQSPGGYAHPAIDIIDRAHLRRAEQETIG
jgi:hypothetical protein